MQTNKIPGWVAMHDGDVIAYSRDEWSVVSDAKDAFEGSVPRDCYLCEVASEEAFALIDYAVRTSKRTWVAVASIGENDGEDLFAREYPLVSERDDYDA
jgi:hypothetical protein